MTLKTLFLTATLIVLGALSASALVHPGGWLTQDELAVIRENVTAQAEPGYGAWLALIEDGADTDYTADVETISTGVSDFQRDAHAAYTLTMKWVASGEQAYADTAIEIIDDWVDTVTSFDHGQTSLRNGIAGNKMAQAAEILAWGFNGESGWSTTRIAEAQAWFKEVVYPYTSTGEMRSTNWGTSALAGCMSMAVFCDDQAMFDHACDAYRYGFQNTTDGYCAVTDYIINAEGQCYESGRDQVHTQGGIAHLVETAMTAWNQGVDLVSFADYRLVAGLEYTAKYNVGYDDVPWTTDVPNPGNLSVYWPDGISEDGRGEWSPIYIQAATLFERAGQAHPYTEEVIASSTYPNPETHNSDHPGLGTLCFIVEQGVTQKIEAESHIAQSGTRLEDCSDTGAGQNVAFISHGDWCQYPEVVLGDGGSIQLRVARPSGKSDSTIEVWIDSLTGTQIATVDVPETGGWQDWITVIVDCPAVTGQHPIFLKFVESGTPTGQSFCNINWFSLVLDSVTYEAETFSAQSGTELEPCSDVGGGTNVANINRNDWCRYDHLFIASNAVFNARVARPSGRPDGIIEIRADDPSGTLLGSVAVPETGSWQTYETIRVPLTVDSGTTSIVLVYVEDGTTTGRYLFNLNHMSITPSSKVNPPETLRAEAIDANQIDLSWSSLSDATAYTVKRASVSGSPYSSLADGLSTTNYSDLGVLAGTNYTYVATALYGSAESGYSEEISVIPSNPIEEGHYVVRPVSIVEDGLGGNAISIALTNSERGHAFQLSATDQLTNPTWQPVGDVGLGNGGELILEQSMDPTKTNQFYRLNAWRQ